MRLLFLLILVLGAWLCGTLWMWATATQNFAVVEQILSDPPEALLETLRPLPEANVREAMRYQASEANRKFFADWAWIQLGLGIVFAVLTWLTRRGVGFKCVAAAALGIVIVEVLLVQMTVEVGRAIDFDGTPQMMVDRFWTLHHLYTGLDMAKFLGLLGCAVVLLRGQVALPLLALTLIVPGLRAEVDFARQVHPILVKKCFACHSASSKQGGLSVEKLEDLIQGGASGAGLVPGAAEDSLLYQRVAGLAEPRMPMGMPALTDAEIAVLREWIDEGATWDGAASEGPLRATAPLAPRDVEIPNGDKPNPVDRFLDRYRSQQGYLALSIVSDAVFVRRAFLDLWGIVPPRGELERFSIDPSPTKRAELIERLLANDKLYAGHWISFYNDLLRNDEGVVYHGGRESITDWLLAALRENTSYDQMVRELLNPRGEDAPEGFLIGVNWRGTVNASQTPPMQAAQNSAQVFLGINLKCASCHDSFVNQWKLADSYGLAGFFSEEPLELVRCDAPTGEMAAVKFLFPGLGSVRPDAPLEERRERAAELFTSEENGRLARTIVNRYWKRLMGRGLIEPADDMDQQPWDADLMDWLAVDLVAHDYDLKHLLRRIMTSETYQLPSESDASDPYVFRGPLERRMSAEQFGDSLSSITGEWPARQVGKRAEYARDWRLKATPLGRAMGRPVRDQVFTERNERATTLQMLELLNGETLTRRVRAGAERLLGRRTEAPRPLYDSGTVRGGSKDYGDIVAVRGGEKIWLVAVDSDSYDPTRVEMSWEELTFLRPDGSQRLVLNGMFGGGLPFKKSVRAPEDAVDLRVTPTIADRSKASDINPRVRFFVFGEEPDDNRLVEPSGPSPTAFEAGRLPSDPGGAIESLYQRALGRNPSNEERVIAMELLRLDDGVIPTEGLSDLLWSLVLLPEFQVIR